MNQTAISNKNIAKYSWRFFLLILAAFLFRVILAICYRGFSVDIGCFDYWSTEAYRIGFKEFYIREIADYPPGYIYVLWVIGFIRNLFNITSDWLIVFILKLPSIICDVSMGFFVYEVARKRTSEQNALIAVALLLFNPAIFINSSMYGQVDAILGLFVLATIYFIYKKNLFPAYFTFCIGFFIKPQMSFIAPVLLLAIIEEVFMYRRYKREKEGRNFSIDFFSHLGVGLASIATIVLFALPFGLINVFNLYKSTIASYPFASVNAYNMWAMFGENWTSQKMVKLGLPMEKWGTIFIILIYALVFVFWLISCLRKHKDNSKYFYMGAFAIIGIFTLSVRMHERYMFPAIVLLLIYAVMKPCIESWGLYVFMSAVHLANVAHILFKYPTEQNWQRPGAFDWNDREAMIIGTVTTLGFFAMLYISKRFLDKGDYKIKRKVVKKKYGK